MDADGPDDAAYGSVTNPERYGIVVDAAKRVVTNLVDTFDVEPRTGRSEIDFPTWRHPLADTIQLAPDRGTPLTFLITDFPGVALRFGSWGHESFPTCGCDACDESPSGVIERMEHLIQAAVDGGYTEELTKRRLRTSFTGTWGRKLTEMPLRRGEWKAYGRPGMHSWPTWPRR